MKDTFSCTVTVTQETSHIQFRWGIDSCLFKTPSLSKLVAGLPTGINHRLAVLLDFGNVCYFRQEKESERFEYIFSWSKLIGGNWPLNIPWCFLFQNQAKCALFNGWAKIIRKCQYVTGLQCGFFNICPLFWFLFICRKSNSAQMNWQLILQSNNLHVLYFSNIPWHSYPLTENLELLGIIPMSLAFQIFFLLYLSWKIQTANCSPVA